METPVGILRRVIWEKGFEEELCIGSGRFKREHVTFAISRNA
jgi:hypothetical protein